MSAQQEQAKELDNAANQIWRYHAALDAVYGKGWSKLNPETVAKFMQAAAMQNVANELAGLREILASGSGGITVGLEKT